jgi:hypothetical protein
MHGYRRLLRPVENTLWLTWDTGAKPAVMGPPALVHPDCRLAQLMVE